MNILFLGKDKLRERIEISRVEARMWTSWLVQLIGNQWLITKGSSLVLNG